VVKAGARANDFGIKFTGNAKWGEAVQYRESILRRVMKEAYYSKGGKGGRGMGGEFVVK